MSEEPSDEYISAFTATMPDPSKAIISAAAIYQLLLILPGRPAPPTLNILDCIQRLQDDPVTLDLITQAHRSGDYTEARARVRGLQTQQTGAPGSSTV
ncbi:hypothetical protein BD626DRAFT_565699 [Schizophyllum amplum]|uniref:Uncharacterized protein n=1 Tax=Schizophyllum amplum TaxID=97359 RepID=A0A550CP86_9AGAR|nr:hypothetical protein BD626DRAFT_565699 [Auriculariopsis ampla]